MWCTCVSGASVCDYTIGFGNVPSAWYFLFLIVIKIQRYNWDIVENGAKHHNPNLIKIYVQMFTIVTLYYNQIM